MSNLIRLDDGFSTIITLQNDPTIKLYEREVTPPGTSGGGPIDTTNMRNVGWRTSAPKSLRTLSPLTATVAFATEAIDKINAQIHVNQIIQVQFPDLSTIEFWGWVEEFTFGAFTEGEQPTATMTVHPSNRDNDGNQVDPWYTEPTGSAHDLSAP